MKVDGPYFPCCFPSLAAAAWHSLAAAWAAVVVFELLFVRSAAVFAVVVVFGFAAGVARSLFVAPFFAAVAVAAGAASLAAAALLADRPRVALPTDVRSADGWLDDSHLDWAHSEDWLPVGDSGLLSPQADSVLVFLQADSGSASLPADLERADLALVDLDWRDSHLAGSDCSRWADDSGSVSRRADSHSASLLAGLGLADSRSAALEADLHSVSSQVDSHWAEPEADLHSGPADSRGREGVLASLPRQFLRLSALLRAELHESGTLPADARHSPVPLAPALPR